MNVHANIKPIDAFVYSKFLYNMDSSYTGIHSCKLVAVSSYTDHVPTFQIVINNSSIFYYVPSHLLITKCSKVHFELKDLVYFNCPDTKFSLHEFDYLKKPVHVFMKHANIWIGGRYLFTMDWYKKNHCLNVIELDNGQIAFVPNHKISLSCENLPNYKKLTYEWKV